MVRWVKRWTENYGKYFAGGILIIFSQILLCSILYTPAHSEILQEGCRWIWKYLQGQAKNNLETN